MVRVMSVPDLDLGFDLNFGVDTQTRVPVL